MRDLRIKIYANWIEFIIKQVLYPDQMKYFQTVWDNQFLVPAGPGWGYYYCFTYSIKPDSRG
jgi:hypothetical protein